MPSQGRPDAIEDLIDLDRALALSALLDEPEGRVATGGPLPLMWHLVYFLPRPRQSALRADGHPGDGLVVPPSAEARRMFAGGRVRIERGLRIGAVATSETEVVDRVERVGRSGPLTFVTTRSTLRTDGDVALVDERDIVYLPPRPLTEDGAAAGERRTAESRTSTSGVAEDLPGETVREVVVDETLLFRFSALTYNAHRIHYDRDFAQRVEGHPDLVVHGPLQALLLAEVASTVLGGPPSDGWEISYRLTAPLYLGQGLRLRAGVVEPSEQGASVQARITDAAGRTTASATVARR